MTDDSAGYLRFSGSGLGFGHTGPASINFSNPNTGESVLTIYADGRITSNATDIDEAAKVIFESIERMFKVKNEREAVVAMLRQDSEVPGGIQPRDKWQAANLQLVRNVLRAAADRIERGDHLKAEGQEG